MAVSVPFWTPSVQLGAAHKPAWHTKLWQSAPVPQPLSSAHGGQDPPQSVSVSVPFLTPSVQLAGWQRWAAQIVVSQSAATSQPAPEAHFWAQVPPQSMPVSVPS